VGDDCALSADDVDLEEPSGPCVAQTDDQLVAALVVEVDRRR
jgi:hypothetical protein